MEEIYRQLAELARRHGAQRLVLFGSRAEAGHRAYTPRHGPQILKEHREGWCDAVCCRRLKTIRTL